MRKQEYDIAAYVWPSYSGDDPRTLTFWPEGIGEWQSVRDAKPKFPGHVEPRKPLWGYVNEADPNVMEMQIDAAVNHGVNVFIYDWYWYDNRPFLENCLNDGFLGAPNNEKMKFYVMWANHNATNLWDKRNSHNENGTIIWEGTANRVQFETVCHRIIDKYFSQPNYYKIDGKPVFMFFDLPNLIKGLGGIEETKKALCWFKETCIKEGYLGLHLQSNIWYTSTMIFLDGRKIKHIDLVEMLGFASITNYQFSNMSPLPNTYSKVLENAKNVWEELSKLKTTYIPHVSVGWDNNTRFYSYDDRIISKNTPDEIERAFRTAKEFLDNNPRTPKLITVNSWNEWTEGSYLQPDELYGYGYLEAIKKVFR